VAHVPIVKTAVQAWSFSFSGIARWLPAAIVMFVASVGGTLIQRAMSAGPTQALAIVPNLIAAFIEIVAFAAMIRLGQDWVTDRQGTLNDRVVKFVVGPAEFSLFGLTMLGQFAGLLGLSAIVSFGAVLGGGGQLALMMLALVAALWLIARVSLAAPEAVSGHRLSLRRVWAYSQGEAWRIVLALLLTLAPFLAMALVVTTDLAGRMTNAGVNANDVSAVATFISGALGHALAVSGVQTIAMPALAAALAFLHRGLRQ